jgi:hypothetical protein
MTTISNDSLNASTYGGNVRPFKYLFLSVLLICSLLGSVFGAEQALAFKFYAGSSKDLIQTVAPSNARFGYLPDTTSAGWEVKAPDGNLHRVGVNITVWDENGGKKKCGEKYTVNACAFQVHTQGWASSYLYEKDWRIKYENWSDAWKYTTLKTNVKREDVCVHRREASGATSCLPYSHDIARNLKKNGNYHYIVWKEKGGGEFYKINWGSDMNNVMVWIFVDTKDGFLDDLPEKLAKEIMAKLPRTGTWETEEEPAVNKEQPKEARQADQEWRPEAEAYPFAGLEPGTTALIPALENLPAKIAIKNGKPNSIATFHLKKDGGLLRAGGKSNQYEMPVKVDGRGNAEALFFYKGGDIAKPVEYEVVIMNEGKKATAKIIVGLGLAFDKIRAVLGQSLSNNTYAFTLSVKSAFHPALNVQQYLKNAEDSRVWGDKRLGLRMKTEWMNKPAGAPDDEYYYGTAEVKTMAQGNALTATPVSSPKYTQAIYDYPAVAMKSEGNHIYQVKAELIAMQYDGVVAQGGATFEKMAQDKALLVLSLENPDSYVKMLSCAMEPQDAIQYLIAESSKKIPGGAGKAFDRFFSAASIVCGFAKGDYEATFYELGNVLGGEYLDYLTDSGTIQAMSPKVQKAYNLAKYSYDRLNDQKREQERAQIIEKTKLKYGRGNTQAKTGDDIDPKDVPTSSPDMKRKDYKTTSNEAGKEAQQQTLDGHVNDIKKNFESLGNALKGLFR